MPIWLRKFTTAKILDTLKKKTERTSQNNNTQPKNKTKGPDIKPNYTTKTSAK